jgi:hypothetical protein
MLRHMQLLRHRIRGRIALRFWYASSALNQTVSMLSCRAFLPILLNDLLLEASDGSLTSPLYCLTDHWSSSAPLGLGLATMITVSS